MVNNNNYNDDEKEVDHILEVADTDTLDDSELADHEATAEQKLKALRQKLQTATEDSRELKEELQRTKADFLNARKRLEDERQSDRKRSQIRHIETLLPLCDSFYLALLDKATWEKGDPIWRKGIEGIHQQLLGILASYGVRSFDPTGEDFDPQREEALSSVTVTDGSAHNKILTVMQLGYELSDGDTVTLIRPARVMVGEYNAATGGE